MQQISPNLSKCKKCNTEFISFFSTITNRYIKTDICENCLEHEKKEKEEQERLLELKKRKENIAHYLEKAGVGKLHIRLFSSKNSINYPKAVSIFLENNNFKPGLFLTGKTGRGKTFLTVCIMAELIYKLHKPKMITACDLFLEIRRTFDNKESITEHEVIRKYNSLPYLFLDDLGSEKISEYAQQTLFTIIDNRYRDLLPTIITSNFSLNEIAEFYGERVASRLFEMCEIINFEGEDLRLI